MTDTTIIGPDYMVSLPPASELVRVGDAYMPAWLHLTYAPDDGQPSLTVQIQTRDGVPRLVGLSLYAGDDEREIRESDLRDLERVGIDIIVRDALALLTYQLAPNGSGQLTLAPDNDATYSESLELIHNLRKGRTLRTMTPALLKRVAKVYQDNPKTPRRAVANEFGVADPTASKYIGLARKGGYLQPVKKRKRTNKGSDKRKGRSV